MPVFPRGGRIWLKPETEIVPLRIILGHLELKVLFAGRIHPSKTAANHNKVGVFIILEDFGKVAFVFVQADRVDIHLLTGNQPLESGSCLHTVRLILLRRINSVEPDSYLPFVSLHRNRVTIIHLCYPAPDKLSGESGKDEKKD